MLAALQIFNQAIQKQHAFMIVTRSIHKNIQGVYVCSKQIQGEKYPDAHFKKSVKQIEKHITSNYNQSKHKKNGNKVNK